VKIIITMLLSVYVVNSLAQLTNNETYGIDNPGKNRDKVCRGFYQAYNTLPKEVRVTPVARGDSAHLLFPDPIWITTLIDSKKDGLAIDLVTKQQFACDNPLPLAKSDIHQGYLLSPLYKNEIMQKMVRHPKGYWSINLGAIPPQFKGEDAELNYLLIKDKNKCYYSTAVNVDFHGWGLLKTGLYYDTLTRDQLKNKFKEVSKVIVFSIPFEKDKAEYKKEDIKPLSDSLNMTDYAIKSITIKAYTSVEGSYERNLSLQNQRAQSMVNALQSYQSEKIESTVSAEENWVEFLSDIATTGYSNFLSMSKVEIKEKLKSTELLSKLEPVLRKHRKAIIEIAMEKRLSYQESNPAALKKFFQENITNHNIDEALYLQSILFYKIKKEEIPEKILNELEIPESIEYSGLLINNIAFLYEEDDSNVFEGISAFKRLEVLFPKNKKIKYNLCALKLRAWLRTELVAEQEELRKEIESLRKIGVPDNLVRRLLINHSIITSEIKLRQKDYVGKDRAVQFIYQSYVPLKLNDADLLSMAKYFATYSKFNWAIQILMPRVNSITVSEDLLFYYLNLTIYDPKFTANKGYRTTMLNGLSRNKKRFCSLFNSVSQGGISFQLLEDKFLKKTFCENCN
jgi:hypothetical protein